MSYKPQQQILTFFVFNQKSPTATGDIPTLRYELLNHLNTFYYSYAPVRVFCGRAHFVCLKKFLKKFPKIFGIFSKLRITPRKGGSTTNFQRERR